MDKQQNLNPNINFDKLNELERRPNAKVLIAVALSIFTIFLFSPIAGVSANSAAIWVSLQLLSLFSIFAVWLIITINKRKFNKQRSVIFQSFAKDNNFSYLETKELTRSSSGTIFRIGSNKKKQHIIDGTFSNLPFSTYQYSYVVGSGKSRRKIDLQVFELTLPRLMPHMVIDSLIEQGNNRGSTLPISFDSSQKITLEGDFHKYFALYAPDKYAVSALTILAPDAMEALMQFATMCDIEIIDNKIYFYWPETVNKRDEYQNMFNTVGSVMLEIQKKLTTADIFSQKSQVELHATTAQRGIRLKQNKWGSIILIGIILTIFVTNFTSSYTDNTAFDVIYLFGFAGIFIFLVIKHSFSQRRKSRLKRELSRRSFGG